MRGIAGKNVLVVGLGISGAAAARLLASRGARVLCSEAGDSERVRARAAELERAGCRVERGGHTEGFFRDAEVLVMSPGVPPSLSLVREARERGVPVLSEIELAYGFFEGRVVAVTGTNGKTTTVTLIERMLAEGGLDAAACGNIGRPFSEIVKGGGHPAIAVIEVSSFQLEGVRVFAPWIAVALNVSEDHLDRYAGFDDYVRAKAAVFRRQGEGDWAVVRDDERALWKRAAGAGAPSVLAFSSRRRLAEGAYRDGDELVIARGGRRELICRREDVRLPGDHNVENALAAAATAALCGVGMERVRKVLRGFTGLPHRMESFLTAGGVRYVNDSKATNPDAVLGALEAAGTSIVLVAGGKDKGFDYSVLRGEIGKRVKALVLTGESSGRMESQLGGATRIFREAEFERAVERAAALAEEGDTVMLSPACSSFDRFANFEERGDTFKRMVKDLINSATKARRHER